MNASKYTRDAIHWDGEASRRPGLYQELESDRFSTAFAYGRHKLHSILKTALCELGKGAKVLDVGCGTGAQLELCRQCGADVFGVEPSPELRAVARQLNGGATILDGGIANLPFDDATFDFVYSVEVLRYFSPDDRRKAYREVLRTLKPGGGFLYTMSNRYALDGFVAYSGLKAFACRLKGVAWPDTYFATPGEISREWSELGVTEVSFTGCVLGPIRLAYKFAKPLAPRIASALEPIDDALFQKSWAAPFAGHLVAIAKRPMQTCD